MAVLPRKEAVEKLNKKGIKISHHHLYTLIRAKKIPYYEMGRKFLVDTETVEEYLKNEMLKNIRDPIQKIRAVK